MSLNPRDTLDTMLGLLGFVCEVKEFEREHGLTLMVYTAEADRLIGRNGALLEDTQLLLNRVLLARDKQASKVQVDIEHWRRSEQLLHEHRDCLHWRLSATIMATKSEYPRPDHGYPIRPRCLHVGFTRFPRLYHLH